MSHSYAEMVRKALRHDPAARTSAPAHFPADRERLVAAVERGLRVRRRRRAAVRWTMAASAVAAAVALFMGGRLLLAPHGEVATGDAPRSASEDLRVLNVPEAWAGKQGTRGMQGMQGMQGMMVGEGTAPVPLRRGMTLPRGTRLVAPVAGEVGVGAPHGTTLTLEGGGEMSIRETGRLQRYELRAGAVRAKVAKLAPGERFIIATADAEVEVHGTAFRVGVVPADPSCGAGTTTRVSVTEGVVSVRRGGLEARITPGGSWPEACANGAMPAGPSDPAIPGAANDEANEDASALAGAGSPDPMVVPIGASPSPSSSPSSSPIASAGPRRPAPRSMATAGAAGGRAAGGVRIARPAGGPAAPGAEPGSPETVDPQQLAPTSPLARSILAAQNDLFASGVRAKRRGHGSEAVRIFERFLRKYPDSPLAEGAAAQRMNLLRVIDLAAARRAAGDYLSRYPAGFARAEAQQLADTSGF
jgi:hypothetical protein